MNILNTFSVYFLGICILISQSAFAVETQYGQSWKKYIFNANVTGDLTKLHGENYLGGFGSAVSPYIYPGCLAKTLPVRAVGPGKLRAELRFYSNQWRVLDGPEDLTRHALFSLSVAWESPDGTQKNEWMTVPSSYLGKATATSTTADGKRYYFLELAGYEPPLVTPEYSFDEDAKNITVSVCYLMDQTSISIREIILTVPLDKE